jgi:hypothetical protein
MIDNCHDPKSKAYSDVRHYIEYDRLSPLAKECLREADHDWCCVEFNKLCGKGYSYLDLLILMACDDVGITAVLEKHGALPEGSTEKCRLDVEPAV